jgi:hypothetical protein
VAAMAGLTGGRHDSSDAAVVSGRRRRVTCSHDLLRPMASPAVKIAARHLSPSAPRCSAEHGEHERLGLKVGDGSGSTGKRLDDQNRT